MKKLLFALVCFVASLTFASCGAPTPADEAAKWLELIKAKDYKGFVETIKFKDEDPAKVEKQKEFYCSMFEQKADKTFDKKGGIDSYNLVSKEISEDGSKAKVKFELTYGDGSKDDASFDMVLVDGKWMNEVNK